MYLLQQPAIPCLLQRASQKKRLMRRGIVSKQKEQSDPEVRTIFKELIEKSNIFGIYSRRKREVR